jgi:hypothetical protein
VLKIDLAIKYIDGVNALLANEVNLSTLQLSNK